MIEFIRVRIPVSTVLIKARPPARIVQIITRFLIAWTRHAR
ncbi:MULTISPECIES: hypothetical protein [unclassified Nonomuraea]